ncbi:hypothetical protein P4O66_002330 [Electrophorus voltai]|uniref:Cadherin domain-containing protein n=1 Tax=Electrophorus voltai TaxID=2609070 RepID=A0AAD8YZU8_9TELE|nr:hypothetical protein P4O66_002330 [Electrophorus voltai]
MELCWILVIPLLSAPCAGGFDLHLSDTFHLGTVLANMSLGPGWTYKLDRTSTSKAIGNIVTVDGRDGAVRLVREVDCARLPKGSPLPLTFRIASSASDTFVIAHFNVFVHGQDCFIKYRRKSAVNKPDVHVHYLYGLGATSCLPSAKHLSVFLRERSLYVQGARCLSGKSDEDTVLCALRDSRGRHLSARLPNYQVSVPENEPAGTHVITLKATDADGGEAGRVEYGMEALFDSREFKDTHVFKVTATDHGAPRRSAASFLTVTVGDANDHDPVFEQSAYRIVSGDDGANSVFEIDSRHGLVKVKVRPDREVTAKYELIVEANDQGKDPGPRSATATVHITVEDENDNYPQFSERRYVVQVPENVPVNTRVAQVEATDKDEGNNAKVHYSIINGNVRGQFYIHTPTGEIDVINPLDYETNRDYSLRIKAQDGGRPPLINSTGMVIVQVIDVNDNAPMFAIDADSGWITVSAELDREATDITVLDVNDNVPTFTEKVYSLKINEDALVGTSVLTVTAVDRDINSVVTYQISSGNTRNRFAITSQSGGGLITLALPLDYKQERQYVLTITASDGTRPVFQSANYQVLISEDKPIGSTFKIDPDSGAITTQMEIDYEDQASYTLAIIAHDNGIPQKMDTTYVEIIVEDANDNAPQFSQEKYQGKVFEDVSLYTSVLQISASDRDSGSNGRVSYTFQGGDDGEGDFFIEQYSGIIRTNRKLDRENVPVYNLRAFAIDRGSPPLKAAVEVQVSVLDINDNAPVFEKDELYIYVKENSPAHSVVAQITATDPDEGTNAQIMYQIVEGNVPEVFDLDIFTGDLKALMDLDYETKTEYVIVVQATSAPLVSRATVHIRLVDINDNDPVLHNFEIIFNNYVTNKSNSFPTGVIGKVPAHDPDVSDKLQYSFVEGNELSLLILNPDTGELKLSRDLDNNRPLEAIMKVAVSGIMGKGVPGAAPRLRVGSSQFTEHIIAGGHWVIASPTLWAFWRGSDIAMVIASPSPSRYSDGSQAVARGPGAIVLFPVAL